MRILTIVADLGKGGTQRAAQNFALAYKQLGHDSRVISTRAGGVRFQELLSQNLRPWIGMASPTLTEIKAWSPEVLHIHSQGPTQAEVDLLLDTCLPATVVETNVFSRPSPWVSHVDLSFQLTTWCHWLYAERTNHAAPAAVVPNPINTASFRRSTHEKITAFRTKYGIDAGDILLGRVGQSHEAKWSPLLLHAFEMLRDDRLPAKLMVVNPPPSVITHCSQSRHASHILIVDEVIGDTNLNVLYSAFDIFVHAADLGESFGLALAESLLCETPVVTLSTPWNDNSQCEVVRHELGGFVATTPPGFISAVRTLALQPVARRALGSAGRQHILRNFDSLKVAQMAIQYMHPENRIRLASPPNRGTLLDIYRDAYDTPSRLTLATLGRLPRLSLTRYSTGYEPWSNFGKRLMLFLAQKTFRKAINPGRGV